MWPRPFGGGQFIGQVWRGSVKAGVPADPLARVLGRGPVGRLDRLLVAIVGTGHGRGSPEYPDPDADARDPDADERDPKGEVVVEQDRDPAADERDPEADARDPEGEVVVEQDRDPADDAGLLKRSVDERWALVTIHGSIDTSTAMGRAYVHMAGLFAELERGMIGERTKAGMAQKRAEGQHLGRHTVLPPETAAEVRRLRDDVGLSWPRIAKELTARRIPTATGRSAWRVSSVQSAYRVRLDLPPKRSAA